MTTLDQLRADIVEVGRRLWTRGFVASNDGNISVRIGPDRLLMTPASVSKGFMTPEMMVVTDLDGTLVSGAPGRKPSSEILMHLVAYRAAAGRRRRRPRASAARRPDLPSPASRSIAPSSPRS